MTDDGRPTRPARWRTAFEVTSTLVMLGLAATLVWQRQTQPPVSASAARQETPTPVPTEPIDIAGSPTLGLSTANVVIVEFADFECPACGMFARDLKPALVRQYVDTGKVRFVFKNFPLSNHPRARVAAKAAACASRQGKFWQMHDALFASMKLDENSLDSAAKAIGADFQAYRSCRTIDNDMSVDADKSLGEALGLEATPTFYFGKVRSDGRVQAVAAAKGARTIDIFRSILNDLLQ